MELTLKPSLQHFGAVSIGITLWNSDDVRNKLKRFVAISNESNISMTNLEDPIKLQSRKLGLEILEIVLTKIDRLPLSEITKCQVRRVVRPIGNEIFIAYNEIFTETKPSFDFYMDHLTWTPWGRINESKTVELFIGNDDFKILQRYVWACTYYCGQHNVNVWKKCSQEMDDYAKRNLTNLDLTRYFEHVTCWKRRRIYLAELMTLLNEQIRCPIQDQCVTEMVMDEADETTFQQFWSSSSHEKKVDVLRKISNTTFDVPVCCSEVLFFLLTQMTHEQRTTLFRKNAYVIGFHVLRNWPLRNSLFLQAVKEMGNFLSKSSFKKLLLYTVGLGDQDFPETDEARVLFEKLWINSPYEWKNYVFKSSSYSLILTLVLSMDGKSMKLMLSDVDVVKRRKMFRMIKQVLTAFPLYICNENWNLIDDFFRDVSFIKNDIWDFKISILLRNDYELCRKFIKEGKWRLLDKFVNWATICEKDKIRLKRKLAYSKGAAICQKWIIEDDLMAIEQFINWCFSSEVGKSRFKNRILSHEIKTFLSTDRLETAEDLMYRSYKKDKEKLRLLRD